MLNVSLMLEWKCCKDVNGIAFTENFVSFAFFLMILIEVRKDKELIVFVSNILILKRTLKIYRKDILVFQKFINSEMYLSKNNWINLFSLKTI